MEKIIIEVTDETAEKWRSISPEKRERISHKINIELTRELLQEQREEIKKAMDKIGRTARENGLTEEILREILAEDE